MRVFIAHDAVSDRWVMLRLSHHLIGRPHHIGGYAAGDSGASAGRAEKLPAPLPFRNLVAQARLGVSREEHEAFFRDMLGDVEEPTAPFGLMMCR